MTATLAEVQAIPAPKFTADETAWALLHIIIFSDTDTTEHRAVQWCVWLACGAWV